MNWQFTPFALPSLAAAVISWILAIYAWRRRSTPGAGPIALLMAAAAWWSLWNVFELCEGDLAAKVFWAKVQYLGIVTVPVAWLAFNLQYTLKSRWLKRRNIFLLAAIPSLTVLLVWSNEFHSLMWKRIVLDNSGPFLALDIDYGFWFWIQTAYSYTAFLIGSLLLAPILAQPMSLYRKQAAIMLLAGFLPFLLNIAYIFGLISIPNLDLTPFAFTLTGMIVIWGLRSFGLLDIAPMARRMVVDNMRDGVMVLDSQNRIVDFNQTIQKIANRPLTGVIGAPAVDVLSSLAAPLASLYEAGRWQSEISLTTKDSERHYDLNISHLDDGRGNIVGRLVLLHDITQFKRIEQSLREKELQLRQIIDLVPHMIFAKDRAGRFILVNQAVADAYGLSVEELTGSLQEKYYPDKEALARMLAEDLEVIETNQPKIIPDHAFITQKGNRILQTTKIPFTASGLNEPVALGIAVDITERKYLEDQLRQAQKMEAVGRLAGGVAHDFNNLLTALMGYAKLAAQTLSPDHPAYSDLESIQKTTQRAANLVRQLLTFARQQVSAPEVLNLNNLILNTNKMLRHIIGEDIELVFLLSPNLRNIEADPGHIEQVLVNLVVNARDAMPRGGKLTIETANITLDQLYIRQRTDLTPGEYVMLAVADEGTGVAEEIKEHLFDPFFTTKEVGKGTGLGLSTCFGIVKENEGHIEVESQAQKGTTFKVYLPCAEESAELETKGQKSGKLQGGRETILLVEDEPSVRNLAARILAGAGYTVLKADNGSEGLRLIRHHSPALVNIILTDMVMPQMGGKELVRQVRLKYPDIKALYMSGYADNGAYQRSLPEAGGDFLPKPFTPESILHKVREVLDAPD